MWSQDPLVVFIRVCVWESSEELNGNLLGSCLYISSPREWAMGCCPFWPICVKGKRSLFWNFWLLLLLLSFPLKTKKKGSFPISPCKAIEKWVPHQSEICLVIISEKRTPFQRNCGHLGDKFSALAKEKKKRTFKKYTPDTKRPVLLSFPETS